MTDRETAGSTKDPSKVLPVLIAFLILGLVGGGTYWWIARLAPPPAVALDAGSVAVLPVDAGLPPVLPMADGDALLRRLAAEGGASAELLSWLGVDGVLRRVAATVWMLARGDNPRPVLGFLELSGSFQVREEGNKVYVAEGSYARYDALSQALSSIDGARLGEYYLQLRPYFDSAFLEISSERRFDEILSEAIARVMALPILEGPIELREQGALFRYADPPLEARPAGEKQLLRFGPQNLARLQGQLRRFLASADLEPTPK